MKNCHHTEGPHHACTYVDAINKLIPEAWSATVLRMMHENEIEAEDTALVERYFHEEMMKRAIAKGLRRPFGRAPLLLAR